MEATRPGDKGPVALAVGCTRGLEVVIREGVGLSLPLPREGLPGIDRVLRLAPRVTGRELAGITLLSMAEAPVAVPADVPLTADHPLVAATLDTDGVLQVEDVPGDATLGDRRARSFAGVALRPADGQPLGVLWVADPEAGRLGPSEESALADLGALLEAELERSGTMGLAAEVQRQLLPERAPHLPTLEMAARCTPAQEVGGDFYDWWVTDGQLQLVVADVMGKGTPAAIVAAAIRAMLRAALRFNPPGAAFTRVAGDLQDDLDHVAKFATCFGARIDPATGRVRYVDAGHGLAVVLRTDGTAIHLAGEDPPLGALAGAVFQEHEVVLQPGDTLLAVSDGVLDHFAGPREALRLALREHGDGADPARLVAAFDDADARITDDLTMVAIRRCA